MKIYKFGGTSLGSANRIKHVANLIADNSKKIVVLSAMSGTTNELFRITEMLTNCNIDEAIKICENLFKNYREVIAELFETKAFNNKANELINSHFDDIKALLLDKQKPENAKKILAKGEMISTALMHLHLSETGKKSALIPALDFMRVDKNDEPDDFYISENLQRLIDNNPDTNLFITQGFICKGVNGEVSNLQRGGSDYSASLIGAAIKAQEIQIWTDIDGFHNNDPRFVSNTKSVAKLSFDEAAELAYFGAKILHPSTIKPAQKENIPVWLKNTMSPGDLGTIITSETGEKGIKAVAAKDNITAIRIKSDRMLMAYGFLRRVFDIFERYKTPIDMISTSEVAVSLTIDNNNFLNDIITELSEIATVFVDKEQTIVCIVGDFIAEEKGMVAKVINALSGIPIRMISYGGSPHNISVLLNTSDKKAALNVLSNNIFG